MPRQTTTLDLVLPPRAGAAAGSRGLYESLRAAILEGRLRPGTRLPSTRDLGRQHGLARGTIVRAFEQLASEGYVEGSRGSGTYVSRTLPEDLLRVRDRAPVRATDVRPPARAKHRLARLVRGITEFPVTENRPSRAFRSHVPALDLFPTTLWSAVAARRMRRLSIGLLTSCPPAGYAPLREAIAAYLGESRGVRCTPEQVLITSGVQESLDLTARLLLNPGDRASVEDPGYPGAVLAFEAVGAKVVSAPVDGEGMVLRAPSLRGVRLVYVTPAHQFPLGTAMSLARRLALLGWARETGALVFEDDYDSEFRYAGRPIPSLQGLSGREDVLFAGTFSKVLFPALRLGYLVVPADLVEPAAALKSVVSRHPPLLDQAVLYDFMAEGHFARHLRRMRQTYAQRLACLLEAAREHLDGFVEMSPVAAGLQTVAWLKKRLDAEKVAAAAARRGVEVTPLGRYRRVFEPREGLQLGFAAVGPPEIARGVRELARVMSARA